MSIIIIFSEPALGKSFEISWSSSSFSTVLPPLGFSFSVITSVPEVGSILPIVIVFVPLFVILYPDGVSNSPVAKEFGSVTLNEHFPSLIVLK